MKLYFSTLKSLITLVLVSTILSCGNDPLDVDVSDIKVDLKIQRFDQDLFQFTSDISKKDVEELNTKYGLFFQDFTESVINIGSVKNPNINYQLNSFATDSYIKEIKVNVDKVYTDFSPYEDELENAFKHYKYYFPKKKTPEIITFISGFNYAITTDENYLGIGLDMFLGSNYDAYAQLGLPQYKTAFMSKEGLVAGAILGWLSTEFELHDKNADLLSEMIHQGKILYLLDALMPETSNTVKVSYTETQLDWCAVNEESVWFYFIDNNLLYTKESTEIIKYMGEAPFIQGFPEGSPGRIGHWLGWQIVKSYMKENPTVSLQDLMMTEYLMLNSNAQEILNKSKYKP
jgi:gliding motility-associated lipoprotein GldB